MELNPSKRELGFLLTPMVTLGKEALPPTEQLSYWRVLMNSKFLQEQQTEL